MSFRNRWMKRAVCLSCGLLCSAFLLNGNMMVEAYGEKAGVSFYRDDEEEEKLEPIKKKKEQERKEAKKKANGTDTVGGGTVYSNRSRTTLPQTGEAGVEIWQIAGVLMLAATLKGGMKVAVNKVD